MHFFTQLKKVNNLFIDSGHENFKAMDINQQKTLIALIINLFKCKDCKRT